MLGEMTVVNTNTIKNIIFIPFRLFVCLSLIEVDLQIGKNH